jgi:hypothetical protein
VKPPVPLSGSRDDAPPDRAGAAAITVLAVDDQPIFLRAAHR